MSHFEPLRAADRQDDRLSPVRGPVPGCPIFLLHGAADNVIPPDGTLDLAAWAAPRTPVSAVVTPIIGHVEMGEGAKPGPLDYLELARFFSKMLGD
jgi:fermentation-respiration switch protein FrsA (DUF1100 family)